MIDQFRKIVAQDKPMKLAWGDPTTGRTRYLLINVATARMVLRVYARQSPRQQARLLWLPLPQLISTAYRLEHKL